MYTITGTKQEIFDTIIRHLDAQGRRSISAGGKCAYLAPNGDRCAIGCLIPREHYRPEMENKNLHGLLTRDLIAISGEVPRTFFREMQDAHDQLADWKWWSDLRDVLQFIAQRHDLDTAVLDTLKFNPK